LTTTGALVKAYNLGAKVLDFREGLAATADGQIYQLETDGPPIVIRELEQTFHRIQLSATATAMLIGEREVNLMGDDGSLWKGTVDSQTTNITTGDLNGDGKVEVAVGTNDGRVYLFGLTVNQPPLLTNPSLAETRGGYAYSIDVNDPDGNTVTTTLEIWDPSAGLWLTQLAQALAQGQGQLNLNVSDPFDTWDSGQESRFRFRYDDGHNQGVLAEVPGPFSIPTLPWYLYYGQWAGLGALILLPVALGWVIYRRQRSYRRSPVGQAESLLKQLRTQPGKALVYLHDLARDDPALLAHLPGLAREAGETNIANMSEGFQLILTRPEVAVEGLRAVVRGGAEEPGVQSEALQRSRGAEEQGSKSNETTNDLARLYNRVYAQ
jgi:hypothetical protein